MLPLKQALQLIEENVQRGGTETISLADSVGRVLAVDIKSDVDCPPHDKSIMDGFAVRSEDVAEGAQLKVLETVPAGTVPKLEVGPGTATRIMTGAPLPTGANAVVMIERTTYSESDQVVTLNLGSVQHGQHVMNRASATAKGDTVLKAGHKIRPQDIGLLAECGAATMWAVAQPSIAILPTGDELVSPDQVPGPGMIRNSNGPMLLSLAQRQTSKVVDLGVGLDNREQLAEKVKQGLESDFLVLSGGVSAGMLDLVPGVLAEQNVTQVFHKVAVKPGKPIWFGIRKNTTHTSYVFGLPGNPVSSLVGFNLFVRAALSIVNGGSVDQPERLSHAVLAADHEIRGNRITYWPIRLEYSEVTRMAHPVSWKGSSDLRALGTANGLGIFSPDQNYEVGDKVQIMSLEQ